jgi:ATP-dependent protease Clp ATPase subunit
MGLLSTLSTLFSPAHSGICAGCGRSQSQVNKIIKGPGLGMCDRCTEAASALIRTSAPPWRLSFPGPSTKARPAERCSFCGKGAAEVRGLVLLLRGTMCVNCVDLATQVFSQAPQRAAT